MNRSNTREYITWESIKGRCYNKNNPAWKSYGGRGIKMCLAWEKSFEQFYKDMGPRPPGTSIDRINNAGNYEPGNCRWATARDQALNRRLTSLSSTGVKYVSISGDRYRAHPIKNGKRKHVGYFKTIKQAQKAVEKYLCQKN